MQFVKLKFKFTVDGVEYSANLGKMASLEHLKDSLLSGGRDKVLMDRAYDILRNIIEDDFDAVFKGNMYDFIFLAELVSELLRVGVEHKDLIDKRSAEIAEKYETVAPDEHSDTAAAEGR